MTNKYYGNPLAWGGKQQPPAEAQGGGEASEGWHAALDSASELVSNAPDARYRKRAEQVRDWIKARPDTPSSAPVGVERLVSNAIAQGKLLKWPAVMDTLERLRGTLALAQQPAAVDGAMVERALNARYNGYDVACFIDEKADGRGVIRAALTAALAGQQGERHD